MSTHENENENFNYPPAFKSVERYILGIGNVERIREVVLGRRVEMGGAGFQVHGWSSRQMPPLSDIYSK